MYEENWSATEGHFFPYSSFGKFWQIRQTEHHWGKITSKYVAQIFKWTIKANPSGLQPAWGFENKLLRSSYKRLLHLSGQGLGLENLLPCTLHWYQAAQLVLSSAAKWKQSFYPAVWHSVWTQAISAKSSLTRLNKHKKGKQNWQIKQNIWISTDNLEMYHFISYWTTSDFSILLWEDRNFFTTSYSLCLELFIWALHRAARESRASASRWAH